MLVVGWLGIAAILVMLSIVYTLKLKLSLVKVRSSILRAKLIHLKYESR